MHRCLPVLLLLTACGNKGGFAVYNTPPSATISTPASGTSYAQYETVTFSGRIGDDQDAAPDLSVTWASSIDGELAGATPADPEGYLSYSTANLSAGNHVITLLVVDSAGEASKSEVTITIDDLPENPQVQIVHPVSGEAGLEGTTFTFKVQVSDSKDAATDLQVEFDSDLDGVFCAPVPDASGTAECSQELTAGDHFLTFRATDTDDQVGSATAYFTVVAGTAHDDDGDGWSELQGDCDDTNIDIHPGATELANGVDDDCDGVIDNDTANYDDDGDGYSENTGDCDDADPTVYSGATETYDGTDENCNGLIDEGTTGHDDDGDGFTEIAGDCDDGYALTYPGATELPDYRDNNCNGIVDEGTELYDDDGDGYSEAAGDCNDANANIHPGATETCGDGVDNDCNGSADEAGASGCTTYYRDYDGDGFGVSSDSACVCSATGYYTSRYDNDCYDYNTSANPGATAWFSSPRGDSSYDYNCDGSQSPYYSASGSCSGTFWICSWGEGWDGSVASCGTSGNWVTDCSGFTCSTSTTPRTQTCH